jgi:hypothetical protein
MTDPLGFPLIQGKAQGETKQRDVSCNDLRLTRKLVGLINFEKPNLSIYFLVFRELVA